MRQFEGNNLFKLLFYLGILLKFEFFVCVGRLFLVFVFCLKCLYVYWGGGYVLCLKGKLVIDDWCELDWKSMLFFGGMKRVQG